MSTEKLGIKIEFNGRSYVADFTDQTNVSIEGIRHAINAALSGKTGYITFEIDNGATAFFPTEVLRQSIISIIQKK